MICTLCEGTGRYRAVPAEDCAKCGGTGRLPEPYYDDGQITLYCGEATPTLRAVGKRVDCIVTDPPYGDTSLEWDRTPHPSWLLYATMANSMWCFGSFRFWLTEGHHFTEAGWKYAQEVIWQKHAGSGPNSDRFTRVHELAVHWYRGPWAGQHRDVPKTEWFGPDRVVRRSEISADHRGLYKMERNEPWVDDGSRLMQSVIRVRSEHMRAVHPTQKPLGILRPLIQYSCPPGGIVLDPFAGSGSTLLAARDLGRRAIGIEAREDYCAATVQRLAQGVLDAA